MPILGLDPSLTHFGWVILDENKPSNNCITNYGMFITNPKDGLITQRLILQRERLEKLLKDTNIRFVSMESPYLQDFNTELLFALNQFIHEVFLNLQCFVVYFQPTVLKKYALPDMKTKDVTKGHIIHQAKKELNLEGKRFSEHVSDAYFAAKIGLRFYKWHIQKSIKDKDLSEMEIERFCGSHKFTRGEKKGITEYSGIIYKENSQFFDYRKHSRNTKKIQEEVNG